MMASLAWIKLYIEILYDRKMVRLDDHLWRRAVELFLIAGMEDIGSRDGTLPPVEDIAFELRANVEEIETDLVELAKVGIIEVIDGKHKVRNFEKRQAPISDAERMRQYRARQHKRNYYGYVPSDEPVTYRNGESESESESELKREIESESEIQPFRTLLDAFLESTGISELTLNPRKMTDEVNKWVAAGNIKDYHVRSAVAKLIEKDYTIVGPWSITNTINAMLAEEKGQDETSRRHRYVTGEHSDYIQH